MIDHLKLLGLLINLFIGAGVAFYVLHKAKSTSAPFLKPLVFHIVLLNAAVWLLFLNRYSALNLPSQWPMAGWAGLSDIWIVLIYTIYGGMVFAIMRIVSCILGRATPPLLTRFTLAGMAVLILGYGVKWLVPERGFWWKVHYEVYDNALVALFLLEIGLLVRLWRKSAGAAETDKSRLGKSFAFLYLIRYPSVVLFIPLPNPVRAFAFILFLNAVPVVWLRYFFRPYEERQDRTGAARAGIGADALEAVCRAFDVSKRERDILALILAGKSNRDIERALFISYHTVKNHVYNLFQKLGVKNRFELARLVESRVRERAAGGSGSESERT